MTRITTTHESTDDLLTPEQAAALLGRSVSSVWRARQRGQLTAVELLGRTRFRRHDVLALLEPLVK
jgi:excisionase family DNA binding protein